MKKKVLFLCTHNSARSQIAEGLLRSIAGDRYEAYSAGTVATKVNPYAIKVMAEIGINISAQYSKSLMQYIDDDFDYVVTVCDAANAACPVFPTSGDVIHKSFEDPAAIQGTDEEKLVGFRRVRDEIKNWIINTF